MASGRGFDLREAPQLQPFLLPDARPTGRRIGGGAYGTVEELDVHGLLCAGKKLHEILVEADNQGIPNILRRFVKECSLLSDIRHPHVVQFLGICFLGTSDLPVLVMECLPYCLDSLLEGVHRVELSLAMKCSILIDVARGLVHLHARTPPIIHRDLTAKNILLTSAMMGKIADLGLARILNQQPGRLAVTMTQTPGTLAYMPPEVLEENPKYSTTIDMFSFGHLTLFTLVQDFPYPTPAAVMDPNNPGMLLGRSEVQRRSRQMEQLSRQLGGGRYPLVQLVTQCLHNDPRQRPSARQVLSQLERVRAQLEDRYEQMSKLELIQALRGGERGEGVALQAQITQLQGQLQAMEVQFVANQAETQALELELEASRGETQANHAEYRSRLEHVQGQLQSEMQRSQSRIRHVEAQWRADVEQYKSRGRQAEGELRSRDQEIMELRAQLRRKDAVTTELTRTTQTHQPPQSFNWRRGRDMQFGSSRAYAVALNGKVYVTGEANYDEDDFIVQVYTPGSDEWSRLPKCPVRWFALAVVEQQLVLVGGFSRDEIDQSTLLTWDSTSQCWTTNYPNMPVALTLPVTVSYHEFLVIAGGARRESSMTTVVILNSSTKQWYTASPLPTGCQSLTSNLVGDTLYLLGGLVGYSVNKQMFSISLPALVSHAMSTPQAPRPAWEVTDAELTNSTAVSLHNSLLAVGGKDVKGKRRSVIRIYNPQTRQWTKVGDVPFAVSSCASCVLFSGELMVIGGMDKDERRSKKVYVAKVK